MARKKSEAPDPKVQSMVEKVRDAIRCQQQKTTLWNEICNLMQEVKGSQVTIKLTNDRDRVAFVRVLANPDFTVYLRTGSIITGKIAQIRDMLGNYFVITLDDSRGPHGKWAGVKGKRCEIHQNFIASINGIPFDLGAYR